jgi:hypothetical protein
LLFSFSLPAAGYLPPSLFQATARFFVCICPTRSDPFSSMSGFLLLASASQSFRSSIAFASLCLLQVTFRLRFFKLRRDFLPASEQIFSIFTAFP